MSGHSKWAQIKRQKARGDAKKGQVFGKLARSIIMAVREGGGDKDKNSALAAAIEKAKQFNMPQDSINRAISKGLGGAEGVNYEDIVYEGYGPEGVAFIVEVTTDNKNRTASDVRNIFTRHNGNLGTSGCVSWMFEKRGIISAKVSVDQDHDNILLALIEIGVEDVNFMDDSCEIITASSDLNEIKNSLGELGLTVENSEITMIPKNTVRLEGEKALKVLKFYEALEEHDDVSGVYANFDISDEVMEKLME
jgi:YebC/PmpR family DNA-binding regulatory protein